MGNCSSSTSSLEPRSTSLDKSDASNFVKMLGDTLLSPSGKVATSEALAGKMVGLYFSAHWCPPCRGFTPAFSKAYSDHLKAKGLEVVFVSSDQNSSAFDSYRKEMPWLSLPFEARKLKSALSEKFRVQGIPTLVILNSDATLLFADGRAKVTADPTGKWLPAPKAANLTLKPAAATSSDGGLSALLGPAPFLATDGKTEISLAEVVEDSPPLVALYFSAHWCGPCRGFTPKLITFYEMLREEGIHMPILFGSSDRDEAQFQSYFQEMPWLAFPYGDKRIEALKTKYEVSGIPWLVVLDAKGNLVVNEADNDVGPMGPMEAYQKWLSLVKKPDVAAAPAA